MQQLERDLESLRSEAASLPYRLTAPVESLISETSARMHISPSPALAASLAAAISNLDQIRSDNAKKAQLNTRIAQMEAELARAISSARADAIADADRRMAEARSDYAHACKQLIRAWRDLLRVAAINRTIPGAKAALPKGFHLADLWPASWQCMTQTATSDHMKESTLPCEQREEKAA